jgi:AraC-like DNA-binding protein
MTTLSATYVPAFEALPESAVGGFQIAVTHRRGVVKVLPPTASDPRDDRLILHFDEDRVAPPPRARESIDLFLFRIANALICGFRRSLPPTLEYLESLAGPIADHLRKFYAPRRHHRERRGLSPSRLAKALAYIDQHLASEVAVEDIADAAHLSPFHFGRMFRRSTGMSPHAYVTKRRMDTACEMLASTSIPLAEIATLVGYRTQAHFSHVFRRTQDTTPWRYRIAHSTPARA